MAKGFQSSRGRPQRSKPSARRDHPLPDRQRTLSLHNRQRVRRVDMRFLRRIVLALLRETWPHGRFDLAIYVVAEPEMTHLNETYLRHKGSTDVITFDYAEEAVPSSGLPGSGSAAARVTSASHHKGGQRMSPLPTTKEWGEGLSTRLRLHSEIFVCLDEAVSQARRFHTNWQAELVRYVVHAVLHLLGYDDLNNRACRRMKEAEDTLVCQLARQFDFQSLGPTQR
jgi:rRNA maturation RNase YbeY